MGKAMKAMKAMKTMKSGNAMTASGSYNAVAEKTGVKAKDVKSIMESMVEVAAQELKKAGSFKLGGALKLKLKKKPARPAKKGINPFTKEPCVFKAKPASKTIRAFALVKLKEMIN